MAARNAADRVMETTLSTGTGNLTLAGAETGYERFQDNFALNTAFDYLILDNGTGAWEAGEGYLSAATTLVRSTVRASSNADAAVSFVAGTKYVFNDISATSFNLLQTLAEVRRVASLRL